MAKCVLRVIGDKAKAACRTEQLAGRAESGIEGGGTFYAPSVGTALPGGGMGFLLIDARNTIN